MQQIRYYIMLVLSLLNKFPNEKEKVFAEFTYTLTNIVLR